MSWDIKQNLQTGDWQFDSRRDLQSVEAENLVQQRIHVRLTVDRGQFIYDRTGQLGSRLRSILDMGVPRGGPALEMLIREALDAMDDISVTNIRVFTYGDGSNKVRDPRAILAEIDYSILFNLTDDLVASIPGEYSTQVGILV
jgi:hypothetical protein